MTNIGVKPTMKQQLKSLTARDRSGCWLSNRNSPNSLTLANEFSRWNSGKQSTDRG
jgi:hypothetical protein